MSIEIMTGLPGGYTDEIIETINSGCGDQEAEAYARGYEDGYDQACMDLTDDDLCG